MKGKGGRPRLPPGKRRSKTLQIPITQEEHRQLLSLSRASNKPIAQLVRNAVLNKPVPIVPEINRHAFAQLARLGSNLNQLAHHLNLGTELPYTGPIPDLDELMDILLTYRQALVGRTPRRRLGATRDSKDAPQD
jgi:Bacterial mobilisation protein (MobC)